MKNFLKILILNKYFVISVLTLIGYLSTFKLGNDNPVEEITEEVLKNITGREINLNSHAKKQ